MSEAGIEWNPLSLDCACPPSSNDGKGLLVSDKATDCPKLLVAPGSDYPGIPVCDNGSVEVRSGSVSHPIVLDKLAESLYSSVPTLLIKKADGTIEALLPPATIDGITYALTCKDGGNFTFTDVTTF